MVDLVEFPKLNDRNISNSEVTAWLTCKRMYEFAFGLNLAPKITGTPLARGTLGHDAFSRYIAARLEGSPHSQALLAMKDAWLIAMSEGITSDVVLETKFLVERYMDYHMGWPKWELLGTEERIDLRLTDDFTIPIRYDLLVRELDTHRILIGDFKFTYDFWQPNHHSLNPQLPKYITVMNASGTSVHGGFLEEIRTRSLGKEKASDPKNLWRTTKYYPSDAKKRNMMKQHIMASYEITDFRNKPDEQRLEEAIPALNKFGACAYCNFTDLCNALNDGKTDLRFDIESGYTQNTYGYNKTELEDQL